MRGREECRVAPPYRARAAGRKKKEHKKCSRRFTCSAVQCFRLAVVACAAEKSAEWHHPTGQEQPVETRKGTKNRRSFTSRFSTAVQYCTVAEKSFVKPFRSSVAVRVERGVWFQIFWAQVHDFMQAKIRGQLGCWHECQRAGAARCHVPHLTRAMPEFTTQLMKDPFVLLPLQHEACCRGDRRQFRRGQR